MNVFVYIATTQGLVAVQQIEEEDPDIQSVICLDGSFEQLPISAGYHQFVKKGSGIIHKDFGHGAYRVDVSHRIDQGNSWQLGLYLAHYIKQHNLFSSGEPKPGDLVIWATGVIKADKSVAAVTGVETKFIRSEPQIQQWQQNGITTLCFVPADNGQDLTDDARDDYPALADLVVDAVDNLAQVIEKLDGFIQSAEVEEPPEEIQPEKPEPKPQHKWLLPVAVSVVVVASAVAYSQWPEPVELEGFGPKAIVQPVVDKGEKVAQANQPNGSAVLHASLKQGNKSCDEQRQELDLQATDSVFKPLTLTQLCDLYVQVKDIGTHVLGIALDTGGLIPIQQDQRRWSIPIPSVKFQDRHYVLLLVDGEDVERITKRLFQRIGLWRWQKNAISARLLQEWIKEEGWNVRFYRHTLQD